VADETPRPLDYDDAKLLNLVRAGDSRAFGVLYQRHVEAARRLARELVVSPAEIDDVVAETFAHVLDVLQEGEGPSDALRCYVLAAVRRVGESRYSDQHGRVAAASKPPVDQGQPVLDPAAAGLDDALMVRAFIAQPERWSALLWHLEIEQENPDDVAPLFGLSRDGIGALERRAREGVRQACLDSYAAGLSRADCIPVAERLGAYLRYQLSERRASEVAVHLSECEACRAVYAELVDLGATLRRVVAPVILGSVAASYLSSTGYAVTPAAIPAAAVLPVEQPAVSGGDTADMAAIAGAAGIAGAGASGAGAGGGGGTGASKPRLGRLSAIGPALRRHPRSAVAAAAALLCVLGGVLAFAMSGSSSALPSHDQRPQAGAGGSVSAVANAHTSAPAPKATPSPSARAKKPSATPTTPATPSSTSPSPPSTPSPSPTPSPTTAAPDVTLSVSANVYGPGRGNVAQMFFQVTDTGSASTGALTATITLPSGSSLANFGGGGGGGGHRGNGWTCQATSSGATCQHGGISAGAQSTGFILIQVSGSSACGQPVQVTVTSGSASASASQDIECSQGQGGGPP
jgi:DNA-directed RNA polymerase specialized sigma24 family protein/anti-sigma factor RsiW